MSGSAAPRCSCGARTSNLPHPAPLCQVALIEVMPSRNCVFALLFPFLNYAALLCAAPASPPDLESLQTSLVTAYPADRDLPVTCNFWGCTGSQGLSSLSGLQVYPYSLRNIQVRAYGVVCCDSSFSVCHSYVTHPNYQTSKVLANGVDVPLAGWRWLPFETMRTGLGSPVQQSIPSASHSSRTNTPVCATTNISVATRMQFEGNAVMQRFSAVSLELVQTVLLEISLLTAIESLAAQGMPWLVPLSSDFGNTTTTLLSLPNLPLPVQVTCHTVSQACSAWVVMSCSPSPCNATFPSPATSVFFSSCGAALYLLSMNPSGLLNLMKRGTWRPVDGVSVGQMLSRPPTAS
jgi:hypothetical protein